MNPNNNANFIGRVVRNPELRKTPQNTSVSSFTLAVDRNRPNTKQEWDADFINFVAWGKRAESICKNWKKGDLVAVSGELRIRPYKDNTGSSRISAEIHINGSRKYISSNKAASVPPTEPSTYETAPVPNDDDLIEITDDIPLPF